MISSKRRLVSTMLALPALAFVTRAAADTVSDFYSGKTITLTWGGEEGGSYDLYGRIFAKHASKHIPGNPMIVMRYMPGAGGLRYANYAAAAEPANGLFLGLTTYNTIVYGFMNPRLTRFDPRNFHFLGSMAAVQTVISVWHTKPAKTIEDAKRVELTMGSSGKGSQTYQDIAVANKLLGARFKTILGYAGNNQVMLAIERGEVDGQANTWDAWVTRRPQWLAENRLTHLLQYGPRRLPDLPDVPLIQELLTSPEDKAVVEFLTSAMAMGRPVFAPQNTPADRLAALRTAFESTMRDPEYIADAQRLNFDVRTHVSAAAATGIVARLGEVPEAIRERARQAID